MSAPAANGLSCLPRSSCGTTSCGCPEPAVLNTTPRIGPRVWRATRPPAPIDPVPHHDLSTAATTEADPNRTQGRRPRACPPHVHASARHRTRRATTCYSPLVSSRGRERHQFARIPPGSGHCRAVPGRIVFHRGTERLPNRRELLRSVWQPLFRWQAYLLSPHVPVPRLANIASKNGVSIAAACRRSINRRPRTGRRCGPAAAGRDPDGRCARRASVTGVRDRRCSG